tara:strand:+ start:354 stop:5243 length:4890 start_codon:yes stop_codon:yes gene_type:complete
VLGQQQASLRTGAVLFALLMLFADISGGVLASTTSTSEVSEYEPPILVEGLPPLMCGEELCERPTRLFERGDRAAAEDDQWWQAYGPDLDWNGMDDRLQRVLAGEESVSSTAIMGPDGRKTVAIVVDYAWAPNGEEITTLVETLEAHGWVGEDEGAWFQVMTSIDSVLVDKVPVSALMDIYHLPGVVVIEMQNLMAPFNGVASEAVRSMPSDVYSASTYSRGYYGEGVVIAVLDTGVDNEHRALNDFDDIDDEPDSDPNSYNDQKWVAGFDATSSASNRDGSVDPDDGNGHGTHVAATALGTGGSQRVHTGSGMGAYLVDVKVLTDAGGGGTDPAENSQYSANGIQWVIENKDTDWGNNDSSRGIDIASMSFGSLSTPLNSDDQGDNGSSAEARLVNQARDEGIVCIVAMGNDGAKRVPSPASADGAISIGAADDRNSVNRTDDIMASYSNWGPRLDDGDDDEWDELKPDVSAFGTGIISASAVTGPSLPGELGGSLADNDYDSKDGTSMATPLVSGIVASLLQADDTLSPEDIRNILRNSSEARGSASEPDISNRWNEKWGFGLVDASCALDHVLGRSCTPLEDNGGVIVTPPPGGGDGLGEDVSMSAPVNQSLYLAGNTLSVEGTTDTSENAYVEVQVKFEQFYDDGESTELTNWLGADGTVEDWYIDMVVDDDWVDADEAYTLIYARALNEDGEASVVDVRVVRFARMTVSISEPPLGTALVGLVEFSGTAEGIEHDRIEYKIGSQDWQLGDNLNQEGETVQDWSFTWDSSAVADGSHRISVRLVNASGVTSDVLKRTYEVDNLPAAPNFAFTGTVGVYDGGLPVNSAVAGTVLEVRFALRNIGDLDADEVYLTLEGPGSDSTTYPSEGKVTSLEEGESAQVTLYWWATEAGIHDVTLSLDPNGQYEDPDRSDNDYTFSFTIDERPVEPMLRFLPGAARTTPDVPVPGTPYDIRIRVDNLGQTDASSLNLGLERLMTEGWQRLDEKPVALVPGSSTTSGYAFARFADVHDAVGAVSYRAVLSGSGVEIEHSELRFNITVTDLQGGAKAPIDLSSGEVAVEFVGLKDGGLLFTTIDGELHARTITSTLSLVGGVVLEENWGGELAVYQRDDGLVQVAWSRRSLSLEGYILTDIAMTSISAAGKTTPKHYHMPALKLSEGSYYGFTFDQHDGTMVLAGYHRDLSTSGSWQDITSIFVISSASPDKGNSWTSPLTVLSDIDIRPGDAQPLAVGLGEEYLHILYQEYRDDVSGIERVGLMYTHGSYTTSSWSFQYSVGDNAKHPTMDVLVEDDEDRIIAAWVEGQGKVSNIVVSNTNALWAGENIQRVLAPGVSTLGFAIRNEGVYLYHDEINIYGPVHRMGLVTDADGVAIKGMSNMLDEGYLFGIGVMEDDTIVCSITPTGTLSLSKVASLKGSNNPVASPGLLETLLDYLPGDSDEFKYRLLAASMGLLLLFLGFVVVMVRRSHSEVEELLEEMGEGDVDGVELMITPEQDDGPLLSIDEDAEELTVHDSQLAVIVEDEDESLADELERKLEEGEGNARLERRMKRKQQREMAAILQQGLPPLPAPGLPMPNTLPPLDSNAPLPAPALPLPDLKREVTCPSCNANFGVKDLMLKRITCPVCSEVFDL